MAERHARSMRRMKWAQIVLSALTTGGVVSAIFNKDSPWLLYATALLSFLTLVMNSYAKDLDPGAAAQKHREAASDIWNVRETYLSLLTDIRDPGISIEPLRARRDELQSALYKIYRVAPHTDSKAYGQAQTALQQNEGQTFSDEEIDAFLPAPLKKGGATK